ncbi:AzlD domain-containing protein [Haloarchaeobius sp. HRN-SO-5]|uniref:AzlD domain-containing protein n=1 Tax=Haloarchaeobius sp. HRN-SO-5 TaxID=3446118 RepID=UPI003EBCCBA0
MTSYDDATLWAVFLAVGLATLAFRLSFVVLFGRVDTVPDRVERVLSFVPAAVLTALVVPAVVALELTGTLLDPSLTLVADPAKVIAMGVAAVVAWRTEDVLATIAVGMATLWLVGMVA